jgi:hypothetical protein
MRRRGEAELVPRLRVEREGIHVYTVKPFGTIGSVEPSMSTNRLIMEVTDYHAGRGGDGRGRSSVCAWVL